MRSPTVRCIPLIFLLVFVPVTGPSCSRQATAPQSKPLSEREVIELLQGYVPSTHIADLVNERGIDFEVTSDIKKKFRKAGATQELIEALEKARKDSKEEAKPQAGNLKVKTEPGEAQVYLSDEFKGLTSPEGELRVPGIPPGDYRLRVSKEGYQTSEGQVTVSLAETESVFVTLDQKPTSSEGGEVYSEAGGVSEPVPIYKPNPTVPFLMAGLNIHGPVVLEFVIDASGTVTDCRVVKSLARGLDEKVVETVKTWKFNPAMRNGTPVLVRVVETGTWSENRYTEVSFRLLNKNGS